MKGATAPTANGDAPALDAAVAGDPVAFSAALEQHRRELQVHCYRMLGTIEDSKDLVQETFLRAWRGASRFKGKSSLRVWLYRIATNACLDALSRRPRRVLPYDVGPPAESGAAPAADALPAPAALAWLEPYPDSLLPDSHDSAGVPDLAVTRKESVALAFLAAIQHLTPKQRAALLLRDVLGWDAKATAQALSTNVAAVKSALQRARGILKSLGPTANDSGTSPTAEERAVLERYIRAHEQGGGDALVEVLAEDVRVSFPPTRLWTHRRDTFITGSRKHALAGEYRFVPTRANRQPAVAIYLRAPGAASFRPLTLEVLRITGDRVVEIVDFSQPALFAAFGLPPSL